MPRWYPPIGRPIGTPPRDTHITWPWRLRPAVSYQSSGAASAPGGNTPRALYGAGADGHPEAPDRRPLGACPYRRQCAECSPSKFIDDLFQTVMGRACQWQNYMAARAPNGLPSRSTAPTPRTSAHEVNGVNKFHSIKPMLPTLFLRIWIHHITII